MKNFSSNQFVHGDIRINNLGFLTRNGKKILVLIDFDWSGKVDNDDICYPCNINLKNYKFDESILPGTKITYEHDMKMLKQLKIIDNDDKMEINEPVNKKSKT